MLIFKMDCLARIIISVCFSKSVIHLINSIVINLISLMVEALVGF